MTTTRPFLSICDRACQNTDDDDDDDDKKLTETRNWHTHTHTHTHRGLVIIYSGSVAFNYRHFSSLFIISDVPPCITVCIRSQFHVIFEIRIWLEIRIRYLLI